MRQDEELCTSIIVGRQEIRECVIGEVADAAHHALLHAPGIRAAAQQLEIVVRLDHQYLAAAQVVAHAGRQVAEIGADSQLDATYMKGEADGIDSVMWDSERHHADVANLETSARLEELATIERDALAICIACPALILLTGRVRDVYGNLQAAGQHAQASNVVGVLVSDQDGGHRPRILAA